MANFPRHESLHLTNFTTFADAKFDFSPTINVLVGENGTGKTHLMKVLYSVQYAYSTSGKNRTDVFTNMERAFQIRDAYNLARQGAKTDTLITSVFAANKPQTFMLQKEMANEKQTAAMFKAGPPKAVETVEAMTRPVFIPAIDMMAHTRRFLSTYDEYQIDFDQTHRDIVALLLAPERRQPPQNPEIAALLGSLLGGSIEEENERFYLKTPQGRQPMPLVAEGLRKIATLHQLIRNGFLEPGSVLFWDEPEANVNPKLMDEIVDVLLRLARSGVQIFLSTHSYVILKELDLQAKETDAVRFFVLSASSNGTRVHTADDYADIVKNPIGEQFDYIYDREILRQMGRL